MMSISAGDLRITVVTVPGAYSTELSIKASHVDPRRGIHRTWVAHRSEKDFVALGTALMGALGSGSGVPGPPPLGSSPAVLEGYLRRLIDVPMVTGQPALYDFLEAPSDVTQEPVLLGEVCVCVWIVELVGGGWLVLGVCVFVACWLNGAGDSRRCFWNMTENKLYSRYKQ